MSAAGVPASAPSASVVVKKTAARHPLHRSWTYWELRTAWRNKPGAKQGWEELPIALFDFNTVEDFWIC
jgi:hypothetical protein